VVANDNCNHAKFYRGHEWMSFAPDQLGGCCVGNVNRFMPNFVYHSWMRDEHTLSAVTYCPTSVTTEMDGKTVTIHEETNYPFENTIRFRIETKTPANFTLRLRKPNWAVSTKLTLNGESMEIPLMDGHISLSNEFRNGDEIILSFTDRVEFVENAGGISVRKGALLYALPVKERIVIEGLRETGNPQFPRYSLYADSKWNYAISTNCDTIFTNEASPGPQPWRISQNSLRLTLKGQEIPDWKIRKFKRIQCRLLPRDPAQWIEKEAVFTPKVHTLTADTPIGEEAQLTLVPYCSTRLRIAIFPKLP
jgi:hypothetical protein